MGYLTQKYSTIFRGPWITYIKERRLTTRITKHMHHIYIEIFKKIPDEVEKHKVTKALKDIKKLEKELGYTEKEEYKFIFDESYQEEAVLKKIENIEKRLEQLKAKAGAEHKKEIEALVKQIDNIFAAHIIKAINKLKTYDKSEYKEVMNIINAGKTVDKETFMQELKIFLKDVEVSRWRRFPIRKDVRVFRREIGRIKRDDKLIESLTKEIDSMLQGKKVKDNVDNIIKKITELAKQLESDIIIGFYEAYKGMKRVISMIYILLGYEDTLSLQLEGWVNQKLLPRSPVQNYIKGIEEIRGKLIKDMHIIAQALRRIYQEERRVEREVARLAA